MQNVQAFKVVIAYENLAGAVRAKEMSERLATEMESQCDTWKFELMTHPGLREYAARDAAEADMIIIALRAEATIPEHVQEWIQAWLPQKKESPSILVALLDEEEDPQDGETKSVLLPRNFQYLRQVAQQGGMDFLSNLDQPWVPTAVEAERTNGATHPHGPGASPDLLLRRRRDEIAHSQCHAI